MKKRLIPLFASVALLAAGASSCGNSGPQYEGSNTGSEWTWANAIKDGYFGYIICVGEDGNPEAEDRTAGCVAAIEEICKTAGIEAHELERHTCVAADGSTWSDQAAKEFVERAVTQYSGKIDFIVSNNDGMAIAAAGATGLLKGTPIIGFDALGSACDMIKAGTLAGSVSQNGDDQALATATVLGNLLLGNDPVIGDNYGGKAKLNLAQLDEHIVQTEFAAVTKQNADSLKPGVYVDVDKMAGLAGKKILIATYSNNDNFINETYTKALPHYAEALGFTYKLIQGDGVTDTDLQERVKTTAAEFKPDCYALNIITHANYEQYLAITGDAPVVFFNRQPKKSDDSGVADLSSLDNVYFVGSGSSGQGTAQGQIIKDWYNALSK